MSKPVPAGQRGEDCPLSAALAEIGERWALQILRAAFDGKQHFETFQRDLGIARNILAHRLARLVRQGILERHVVEADRRKVSYELTDKGRELLPVLTALGGWGAKWGRTSSDGVAARPAMTGPENCKPPAP